MIRWFKEVCDRAVRDMAGGSTAIEEVLDSILVSECLCLKQVDGASCRRLRQTLRIIVGCFDEYFERVRNRYHAGQDLEQKAKDHASRHPA